MNKKCSICNNYFTDPTTNLNKLYCSNKCRRRVQTIRTSKLRQVNIERKCKGCGVVFVQRFTRKRYYCTYNCYCVHYLSIRKVLMKNKYHNDPKFRAKMLKKRNEYNHKNPDKVKKAYLKRLEKIKTDEEYRQKRKEWEKQYAVKNKDKIKLRVKEWRLKNIENVRKVAKAYQEKNKNKIKVYVKEWHSRPKVRERRLKRRKERLKTDPFFRLKLNLRQRLNSFVKKGRAKKHGKSNELIGCDWSFFKSYLENKFKKGMTWKNYGKWHIDHIKPMSKFNLFDPKEQFICCNYKNLQPLWDYENRLKSDKIINF